MTDTPGVTVWNGQPLSSELLNYVGPALDLASQTVHGFAQLVGFPSGVDWQRLMTHMLQAGVLNQGADAQSNYMYEFLMYDSKGNRTLADSSPWARYGLDQDSYNQSLDKIKLAWNDLTGTDPSQDIINQAIHGKWSTTELQNYAKKHVDQAGGVNGPWIAAGDSYTNVKQSYISTYGQAPENTDSLASWYKFKQSTKQIGGGSEAVVGATPAANKAPAGDTEVR